MTQMEIITVSKKGQVVLPKKVREKLHIDQGSKLLLVEKDDKLTLSKVESLLAGDKESENLFSALASEKALAKGWLTKEEGEAWKDL